MKHFDIHALPARLDELADTARADQLAVVSDSTGTSLFVALPIHDDSVLRDVRVALAVKLFEQRVVSLGKSAKVAGISIEEMMETLGAMGIPSIDYPPEDLEKELRMFFGKDGEMASPRDRLPMREEQASTVLHLLDGAIANASDAEQLLCLIDDRVWPPELAAGIEQLARRAEDFVETLSEPGELPGHLKKWRDYAQVLRRALALHDSPPEHRVERDGPRQQMQLDGVGILPSVINDGRAVTLMDRLDWQRYKKALKIIGEALHTTVHCNQKYSYMDVRYDRNAMTEEHAEAFQVMAFLVELVSEFPEGFLQCLSGDAMAEGVPREQAYRALDFALRRRRGLIKDENGQG
jgi:predicted HTH domain antitoxin